MEVKIKKYHLKLSEREFLAFILGLREYLLNTINDLLTTGVSKEIYNVAEAMVLSGYVHHRYLDIPRESDNERYKNWQKLQIGGICYTLAHAKLKAKELNINF